jgi:hypothetical protein
VTFELAFIGFGGVVIGSLLVERLLLWAGSVWVMYGEYRTAVEYPHLHRPKRLYVFIPLTLLHSGPWLLVLSIWALVVLVSGPRDDWQSWLLGGFAVGVAYMTAIVVFVLRKHGGSALKKEKAR